MQIAPVADAAGWYTHWVAIERDIGERKLAEATHRSLENQVREAQKMEAIGTLAGGIAHDFNNILGAILGNVALASARSGRRPSGARPAEADRPQRCPRAQPDGTGSIEIRLVSLQVGGAAAVAPPTRTSLAGGGYAHLSVTDSGRGMGAATRARIFEPFFTTKPAGQGTGLGLSVVHGIVASHGGTITVSSRPGAGSRFDLYLPLLEGGALRTAPGRCAPSTRPCRW